MNTLTKSAIVIVGFALTLGLTQAHAGGFIETIQDFNNGGNGNPLGSGVPVLVDVPSPQINPQTVPVLVDTQRPHIDPTGAPILLDTKPVKKSIVTQTADDLRLGCKINGGDLVLANLGDTIDAGARVKWLAGGTKGTIALPHGLRAGQKARIEGVVSLDAGKCSAQVI